MCSKNNNQSKEDNSLTSQTISALRRQSIANADANYQALPPATSGFDKLSIKNPKSFLKPRIHISSFPKLALRLTKPAKETDAYGINFGVTARKVDPPGEELKTKTDDQKLSLVDRAIKARESQKSLRNIKKYIGSDSSRMIDDSSIVSDEPSRFKKAFGSINDDPSCHKASSPTLPISHKKLRDLSHLINQHRLTLDQAILQMRFSHKAIASKVLDLLVKAKNDAIKRGFRADRLIIEQTWVSKGFHTSELQIRARGRHGKMKHPTSKFNIILRQSSDLSNLAMRKRIESLKSKKRLTQRGCIRGSPIRLPSDGVLPSSVEQTANWAW
ncbi:ribosomal protein L22/L17 [Phakopsora pachyrhizi]|nr:ribosomal protein L22/L17 [Phakopsora pachyrhizi]